LGLVGGQQRGGGRRAQRGPAGQRQPAQQPPYRLRLVGVAQPQGALHRLDGAVGAQVGGEGARRSRPEGRPGDPQRQRQPAAQVPHPLGGLGVVGAGGVLRGGRQQLLRARRVQRLHGQLVHPRGQVVGQAERSAGGDQDQAVGPFRDQRAHLEGVGGVVQDDRDRRPRQALVVQLAQPLDLLV